MECPEKTTSANKRLKSRCPLYRDNGKLHTSAKRMPTKSRKRKLNQKRSTQQCSHHLTRRYSYPELMIRTSWWVRLSNFLLAAGLYEMYFTPYCARFRKEHLHEAITDYQSRSRDFGLQWASKILSFDEKEFSDLILFAWLGGSSMAQIRCQKSLCFEQAIDYWRLLCQARRPTDRGDQSCRAVHSLWNSINFHYQDWKSMIKLNTWDAIPLRQKSWGQESCDVKILY